MTIPIIPFYKQIDKLIIKSKDCFLYDAEGKQYIDFESGDWAANLGHSNASINQVIKDQVDLLMHDGLRFRNKPSEALSIRLLEKLSFEDGLCAFLNSGSEAVNLSITLAKQLTKRNKILKMDCSYLSAFGHEQVLSNNPDILNIPMDNTNVISSIDFSDIAAFVFEPGNARGLIKYPGNDFIKAVALAIKQSGGLLIANEVTTGFGRTGKWFGFQHYDCQPDIVAMGKALGNGYPVSCTAINNKLVEMFKHAPFRYAQSHQNDPLGCAVGIEVIRIFEEEDMIRLGEEKGQYLSARLMELQDEYLGKIKEVRSRGLMIGMELSQDLHAEEIYEQLIEAGILVGCRDSVLRFMPPMIIEKAHIDTLVTTLKAFIGKQLQSS
jgi:acetylornithine/N-succinyldiaminopimelate aminotransferase